MGALGIIVHNFMILPIGGVVSECWMLSNKYMNEGLKLLIDSSWPNCFKVTKQRNGSKSVIY